MLQDGSCRPWILIQCLQQPVSCPHDVCSQFFNSRNCPVLSPSVRGEISVTVRILYHTIRGWPTTGRWGPLHWALIVVVQPKLSQRLCLYRSRLCNTPGSTAVHRHCLGSSTKFKSGGTRQSFGKTGHNSTPRCPANTQTLARQSQANSHLKTYSMCQSQTVDNIR